MPSEAFCHIEPVRRSIRLRPSAKRRLMKRTGIFQILLFTIFILNLALPAFSQAGNVDKVISSKTAPPKEDAQKRIHVDAARRLNLLVNRSNEIAGSAARLRVQAKIADALWQRDEVRARALFAKAFDEAITVPDPGDDWPLTNLSCGQVRTSILNILSWRDPVFAGQLAANSKTVLPVVTGPESAILQRMAGQ